MANVPLDGSFEKTDAKWAGTGNAGAERRFTHAEEIIPPAALMGLPGSTKPASPARSYTYADNAWRGASVAPWPRASAPGTSIRIRYLYRKGNRYLMRTLGNEKQTASSRAASRW